MFCSVVLVTTNIEMINGGRMKTWTKKKKKKKKRRRRRRTTKEDRKQ